MGFSEFLSHDKVPFDYLEIVEKVIGRFVEKEKVEFQNKLDQSSTFNVLRKEGSCYVRYIQISFHYASSVGFFVAFIPNLEYFNPDSNIRKMPVKVDHSLMVYVGFSMHGTGAITDIQKNDFERAVWSALNAAWENSYRITPDMLEELK